MTLFLRAAARLSVALTVCSLFGQTGRHVLAQDAQMSADQRSKVIKYLNESEIEFTRLIDGVSEQQWKFKPAPEKWSVAEVAEHIVLAETLLFTNVEKALSNPANPDWQAKTKGKTELLERIMVNRTGKAQAPEAIVPSGKLSRDEVMARFREVRAKTRKFTETSALPLNDHTAEHPFPIFGTLNAYQWLIYIPLHHIRHNQQIAEVKGNKEFPVR